ncbi:MAG TPA: C40 family peptidase [Chitinophagaceae bacterium]|jgi:cell wall-associated NlpC family hydrolase|nr:C40 family peptidase [Chitinophagaceae bacterium]
MRIFLFCLASGWLLAASCSSSRKPVAAATAASPLQSAIDSVRSRYAPDKRTAYFEVTAEGGVLKGETALPEARTALLAELQRRGLPFTDSLRLLPDTAALEGRIQAVVTVSVANLRTTPRHPAELATQALLGTPLRILKSERGWHLVQMPDRYLAWVDGGAVQRMDARQYAAWKTAPKLIYTALNGTALLEAHSGSLPVSDLVYGAVLSLRNTSGSFHEVAFPDGRRAFVPVTEAQRYEEWTASRAPTAGNMVHSARRLLGVPYLWGGTSVKGMDCSGFTKTVYLMNGLLLARDASQQVQLGAPVDTAGHWSRLQPGDLLFFGAPARDGRPERVVHVGLWIGNGEFIHAAGRVQIGSLLPSAPNYDADEHRRFLRAKRIRPEDALADLRKELSF